MDSELREFLQLRSHPHSTPYRILQELAGPSFVRQLIEYTGSESDRITAFLFLPRGSGPFPAVLVHHQHHGQRHFGKSEVAGLCGDPLQAFAPALAARGFAVLAPDSICFEDRRPNATGIMAGSGDSDFLQHFNEMCFRLLRGESLQQKILDDAEIALSVLAGAPFVDATRLGVLGHSYGGNTALFQMAVEKRLAWACASGAVCSYRHKMEVGTSLEVALAVPGIYPRFDFDRILGAAAPRPFLVVSADADKYSLDAPHVVASALSRYARTNAAAALEHHRYAGGHALTAERFNAIVEWISSRA